MIREMNINDRKDIDEMQFELQKYFSEIDQTHESQPYKDINDAHRYMQKMMDDVKKWTVRFLLLKRKIKLLGLFKE